MNVVGGAVHSARTIRIGEIESDHSARAVDCHGAGIPEVAEFRAWCYGPNTYLPPEDLCADAGVVNYGNGCIDGVDNPVSHPRGAPALPHGHVDCRRRRPVGISCVYDFGPVASGDDGGYGRIDILVQGDPLKGGCDVGRAVAGVLQRRLCHGIPDCPPRVSAQHVKVTKCHGGVRGYVPYDSARSPARQ